MEIKVWFRANDPDPKLQFKQLIKDVSKRNTTILYTIEIPDFLTDDIYGSKVDMVILEFVA